RTEELSDLISWLGELVRGVDSSLLDEWEALAHPDEDEAGLPGEIRPPTASRGVTANLRGFTVMVRNALFRRIELAARGAYVELGELDGADGWNATRWREAVEDYFDEYDHLGTGPQARAAAMLVIEKGRETWSVRQIFDDPDGDHDWGIRAEIDLAASDEAGE